MKLEIGEAAALAKQGCKHCYGKGHLTIDTGHNSKPSLILCKCVIKAYSKYKK